MVEVVLFSPSLSDAYGKLDIKKIDYGNPPIGIAYISSYLKKNNHSVKVIDLNLLKHPFKHIRRVIQKEKPKCIGISCMTPSFEQVKKIAQLVKDVDKNIKVVVGGPHPSALHKQTIAINEIDIVVYGEGEETMLDLLEGVNISKIKGIFYKKGKKIIINPPRQPINNLDALPFPDYEELKINKTYWRYGSAFFPHRVGIVTSRGCPYKCTFCVSPLYYGKKFRTRDPKKVVDEIEICINKYNIINFIFWGESFTLKKRYGMKICNEIIKRKLKLKWVTTSRVDTLDLELLKKMKKAGCYLLGLGIETPNEEILKNVRKLTTIKDIKKAITLCKQAGIKTMGHFMFGLPGETRKTAKKTIKFAKNCGVDYAQFYCAVPYPKTEYWKELKKKNQIVSKNWDLYQQNYAVIKTSELTPQDIMNFRTKGFNSFYIRAKFFLNHLKSLHSLGEIYNTMGAISSVVKWFVPKKR